MSEKFVWHFLPGTQIYDLELANKVREELEMVTEYGLVKINPDQRYQIEVAFNEDVYKADGEFYSFPVTKATPIRRRGRKTIPESEKKLQKMYDILSEQLDNVYKVFEAAGVCVMYANIVGERYFPENSVRVSLYTYETEQEPGQKKKSSEARIKVITPSREGFYRNVAEAVKWLKESKAREQEREEKEREMKARHIPNFVRAEDLFAEIARILYPSDCAEAIMHKEMLYKTAIQVSDWPLQIKSKVTKDTGAPIDKDTNLDCPEYLIYTQYTTGEWSIDKTENLKTARISIVKQGYNLKNTSQVIVLHNLREVPYTLFKETDEGFVMVTAEEARGQKKLQLSWNK